MQDSKAMLMFWCCALRRFEFQACGDEESLHFPRLLLPTAFFYSLS
jgi:hypothetical protein